MFFFLKSNFDDMERNKAYVPVNYREFVHKLEQIIEPTKKSYIPTEGEFKTDKNRFDQYKEDISSKMGQYMVHKRNEEKDISPDNDLAKNDAVQDDKTSPAADEKKPYRLNTENFF